MNTPFKVVIPARYGSSRLPGKPLLEIAGKPMIAHVCHRALEAGAEEVVVATDDERIFNAIKDLQIEVVMTAATHESGTERIAEVALQRGWADEVIIVNLQGDEPLIPPNYLRETAITLAQQNRANVATLAAQLTENAEIFNPNVVKVVTDKNNYALYFSRAPIPWDRNAFPESINELTPYRRHIGIYAYRVGFLQRYCEWASSTLEKIECLEQLRILWHGESIIVKTVAQIPPAGVDTLEDLERVRKILTE